MKKSLPLIGFITLALCTIVRLYFICTTWVIADEASYYVWTNHLAWGYVDGGPMIAFINKLFVMLFGVNGFSIRISAVLLVTGLSIYLYYWGKNRFSDTVGALLLILISITPVCFVSSIVHTYDTEMVVFMVAAIAMYYDAFFVDRRYFYPAGIMLGLAMLSKISVVFPAFGIFLFPIFYRPMSQHLMKKEFYLSFLIAGLIFAPFIAWNFTHDFAFIRYKGGMAYRHGTFNDFINVWATQIPLYLPTLCWYAVCVPIGVMMSCFRNKRVEGIDLFFALIAIVPIIYFGLGSMTSRYYGNWVAPVFFSGLFIMPIMMDRNWKKGEKVLWAHIALSIVMLMAVVGQVYLDFMPLKPKTDVTTRYFAFTAITDELKPYLEQHPEFQMMRLAGNDYEVPAMINMYIRPKIEAIGLSLGDYHETVYNMYYPDKDLIGSTFLFLLPGEDFPPEMIPHFDTICREQTFISRRHGKEIGRFTLWYVTGFKGRG